MVDINKLKQTGIQLIAKGNWKKALSEFEKVLEAAPNDTYALLKAGDCYHKLGNDDDALKRYDRAVRIHTNDGDVVKAIAINKLMLKVNPDIPQINARLMQLYNEKVAMDEERFQPAPAAGETTSVEDTDVEGLAFESTRYELPEDDAAVSNEEIMGLIEPSSPSQKSEFSLARKRAGETAGGGADSSGDSMLDLIEPSSPSQNSELSLKRKGARPEPVMTEAWEEVQPKKRIKAPRTELFSELSQQEFLDVVERINHIEFPAGSLIIREGELGDSIFIIASGEVSIFRNDRLGNEMWITNLEEGSFFGEFGFFAESRRHASVRAVTDTVLLELTTKDIAIIVDKHPRVTQIMFEFYKRRVLDNLVAISPMFSVLNREERLELVGTFVPRSFKQGTIIMKEGHPGDDMYFIQKGQVKASVMRDGKEILIATLAAGDFFGEYATITGKNRIATVEALTDVNLARLHRETVKKIVTVHPEIKDVLRKYIKERVQMVLSTIAQYKHRKDESGMI
ncbi:MAG: cyclic nucleotide-binding domain-containing protein [Deltaproteobacteria bacterium]|nr:cyclic nucleotide-binding domain-containing protein [Candidatus Zymogenaceae bacterium]